MKQLDNMKKIVLVLMLLSALSLQAQTTSRIMLGAGGGFATNLAKGKVDNLCQPFLTFNVGYTVLSNVGRGDAQLGFRTGLNATYLKHGNAMALNESFTNVDYYGHQMDYTVTSDRVAYVHQQINVELPIMFAVRAKGLYFNVGAKLHAPVKNKFEQTIENPEISVFYPDYGVTVVNDVTTGLITDNQANRVGNADMPKLMIGLSAEVGHVWQLGKSRSSLGFDLFIDYTPWSLVGGNKDNTKSLVEVSPLVNDCEQPKATVTVNPFNMCNGYKYQLLNFGVKLVYTFDIEHVRTEIPKMPENK